MGKTNVVYERYRFNNRLQESDESIDAYTTAPRTLAETCEFGSLKEDLIRDRFVSGIRDNSLRKKFLQEPKLTLDKCLDSCRAAEATKLQMQAMTNENNESSDVNELKSSSEKSNVRIVDDCKLCGKSHERNREKWPAYGKVYKMCKKENHVASKCHLHEKKTSSNQRRNQRHRIQARRKPFERKCPLSKPISHRKRKFYLQSPSPKMTM